MARATRVKVPKPPKGNISTTPVIKGAVSPGLASYLKASKII